MKKTRGLVSILLAASMALSGVVPALAYETPANAEESLSGGYASDENAYSIYPIPQDTEYPGGEFVLDQNVQVVSESGIDEYTTAFLDEILEDYGRTKTESASIGTGHKILLGINGSGGVVDTWAGLNVSIAKSDLFEQTDSYMLYAQDGTIVILGQDTDAVYYGLATLQMMFSSFAGTRFLNVQIEDYATMKMRGFIEGFYGAWDYEGRESLMRFARDVKMNTYIYASKTDTYHTSATLYPDEDIEAIKELVQVGEETKVKYAWSIHISYFFNGLSSYTTGSDAYYEAFDASYEKLEAKFQQLYDAGVRKFAILNDDFGSGTHAEVVRLLNKLDDEFLTPNGCENLTYCMQGYNESWSTSTELTALQDLNESIDLFWTGSNVNSPITQSTVDFVKEKTGHDAVFWLNYPVNEHAKSGIYLGNITYYARDGVTGLAGAVSNPSRYTESNKVGLFQLAALFWNNTNYLENADTVWEDCFKYLQPEVYESYLTIARNVSNCPSSSRVSSGYPESEYLAEALDAVLEKIQNGESVSDDEQAQQLAEEFSDILAAIDTFRSDCLNENLIEELDPWLKSLYDVATAGEAVMQALFAMEAKDTDTAWSALSIAGLAMDTQGSYANASGNKALAGSKRLVPFVEEALEIAQDQLMPYLDPSYGDDDSEEEYGVYTNIDGLSGTVTLDGLTYSLDGTGQITLAAGEYVGIKLKELAGLENVNITGTGVSSLTLRYSENAVIWQDLPAAPDGELGRYVILYNDSASGVTLTLESFEVTVDSISISPYVMDTNLSLQSGSWENLFDGDESTYAWTNAAQKTNDYIIIDLGAETPIYDLTITTLDGNPKFYNAEFYLSTDGSDWGDPFATVTNAGGDAVQEDIYYRISKDLEGRSARYLKILITGNSGYYLRINEVAVNTTVETQSREFTGTLTGNLQKMVDGNITTVYSASQESDGTAYVTYQITENTKVTSLTFLQDPSAITNAAVTAEIYDGTQTRTETLGVLDAGSTTFYMSGEEDLLSVTITWPEGTTPVIYEIITVSGESVHQISFTGDGSPEEIWYCPEGRTVILPENTYEKDGYTFLGWSDGTTVYEAGARYEMADGDVIFEAVWEAITEPDTGTTQTDSDTDAGSDENTGTAISANTVQEQNTATTDARAISQGETYTIGSYSCKVTSLSKKTVTVTAAATGSQKKVVVPDTVTLEDEVYVVTAIEASAFKNNKKLTSVTIGANVKTIGKNAFSGCTSLKKVTIKSKVLTSIGAKAFFNCKKLASITFKSTKAPKIGSNAFKGIKATCKVTVPKKMKSAQLNKLKKNMKSAGKKIKYQKKG